MKKMKKFISLCIIAAMSFALLSFLSGCGMIQTRLSSVTGENIFAM